MAESICGDKRGTMISIILPYYSGNERREEILLHLKECFKKQTLNRSQYEIIVVEDVESLKSVADIHIKLHRTEKFNKSWHINCGIRKAKFDWILMLDCDIVFPNDYLKKVVEHIKFNPNDLFFFAFDKLIRKAGITNPDEYTIEARKHDCAGGAFVVNKNFWWDIGGANENYQFHGGEDGDIYERVQYARLKKREDRANKFMEGITLVHPYHHFETATGERLRILYTTIDYPEQIIKKLKEVDLGNSEHETLIDLSDIPIKEEKFRARFSLI